MKGEKAVPLRPGGYAFLLAHRAHRASFAVPSVFFASVDGIYDIHYDAGKEIPSKEAL